MKIIGMQLKNNNLYGSHLLTLDFSSLKRWFKSSDRFFSSKYNVAIFFRSSSKRRVICFFAVASSVNFFWSSFTVDSSFNFSSTSPLASCTKSNSITNEYFVNNLIIHIVVNLEHLNLYKETYRGYSWWWIDCVAWVCWYGLILWNFYFQLLPLVFEIVNKLCFLRLRFA